MTKYKPDQSEMSGLSPTTRSQMSELCRNYVGIMSEMSEMSEMSDII
ncbi:hypothetical protein K4039_17000 [Lyngbya sp. CCAP 1446/10]|nr:hypothetical protein [Lyngbya sp. CCAP 1446/10]MCW6051742.1 hypothetical protein [Lyngbya sp. CCAP 1446/10]